jgi:hypothetical protein
MTAFTPDREASLMNPDADAYGRHRGGWLIEKTGAAG